VGNSSSHARWCFLPPSQPMLKFVEQTVVPVAFDTFQTHVTTGILVLNNISVVVPTTLFSTLKTYTLERGRPNSSDSAGTLPRASKSHVIARLLRLLKLRLFTHYIARSPHSIKPPKGLKRRPQAHVTTAAAGTKSGKNRAAMVETARQCSYHRLCPQRQNHNAQREREREILQLSPFRARK
jgi:hypothetical protein